MVRELERKYQGVFPESAPAANPVFFRTYSRRTDAGLRETWGQVCDRTLRGLIELGNLTHEEAVILDKMQRSMKCLPSGRWLWVGGTNWLLHLYEPSRLEIFWFDDGFGHDGLWYGSGN
ncbi:MAG: Adenosylcobalamin-dependent ribonucleoside-triphosphate reductase [Cyanobacteriota bacterium]